MAYQNSSTFSQLQGVTSSLDSHGGSQHHQEWSHVEPGIVPVPRQPPHQPRVLPTHERYLTTIQFAHTLIKVNDIQGAAAVLQGIDKTGLVDIQNELLPETGLSNHAVVIAGDYSTVIDFWKQFNLCWLALGQRILDNLNNHIPPPAFTDRLLERLGEHIIQMCNYLEKFGLVDYEMGVWEEEILDGMISTYRVV
ncbi:unnamed protein product [Aspergillus oryzae]|nr:unnamed protein product [Aspergillus oryzae]GMF96325.1 unnamed protein product [Aspergillus oryzae]